MKHHNLFRNHLTFSYLYQVRLKLLYNKKYSPTSYLNKHTFTLKRRNNVEIMLVSSSINQKKRQSHFLVERKTIYKCMTRHWLTFHSGCFKCKQIEAELQRRWVGDFMERFISSTRFRKRSALKRCDRAWENQTYVADTTFWHFGWKQWYTH